MQLKGKRLVIVLMIVLLGGCKAPPPAPVVERAQPPSQKINYHIISGGETLYSIAWRYELDFQKLAVVNRLPPPYRLVPGRRLSLDTSNMPVVVKPHATKNSSVTAHPIPDTSPRPSVAAKPSSTAKPAKAAPVVSQQPSLPQGMLRWQWPVKGRVSREYDASKVFKGINIYSAPGTSIKSAAPGVVVYAGSGLRGYGQLIIIKHSDKYLSAYAHNRRVFVKENQSVGQGVTIAEVGGDPANTNRMYFEIRENGKPVDPSRLLPKS